MRRSLSSVQGLVLVLVIALIALIAMVLVYAAATRDRELPSTFFLYVLTPLVSLPVGGGLLLHRRSAHETPRASGRADRLPLPSSTSRPNKKREGRRTLSR